MARFGSMLCVHESFVAQKVYERTCILYGALVALVSKQMVAVIHFPLLHFFDSAF